MPTAGRDTMSTRRGYQLLCPIARTLDRVGDRWSLLILRDLHAGPARFTELQEGLGLASNLLSSRLRDLTDDGLVSRAAAQAYQLTRSAGAPTGCSGNSPNSGSSSTPTPSHAPPATYATSPCRSASGSRTPTTAPSSPRY